MFKRILKNERGLTLIELLAVIVILGIIAAIAIPAIGAIMDNSKKDAHIANAKQAASAARLAIAADKNTKTQYTLKELYEAVIWKIFQNRLGKCPPINTMLKKAL
ncbi:hypothetical protein LR69_00201 [Geobacillus sp. BCO2]|nr:hypothetical protein LR69_00201 [Geobacillus sp. BCO2]